MCSCEIVFVFPNPRSSPCPSPKPSGVRHLRQHRFDATPPGRGHQTHQDLDSKSSCFNKRGWCDNDSDKPVSPPRGEKGKEKEERREVQE